MKVVFKEDAVSKPDSWTHLDRIIHRIEDGAHEWSIENPDSLGVSEWLRNCRPSLRELFKDAVKKDAYPTQTLHSRSVFVSVNPNSGELSPQQAARYVAKPLYVLVENRFTDGQLLETALDVLSPEPLQVLRKNKIPDLIYCDGPGGNGELLKLIQDYVAKAQEECNPARIIVFTDSDGKLPGCVDHKPKEIEDFCKEHRVPCLILNKRAIENYIPDEILKLCVGSYRSQVAALLKLTKEQRDHFPIKSGIKDFSQLPAEEVDFYASLSDDEKRSLGQGLGACRT
ncbi:MAG: hypothetical protein ACYCY5_08960 [Sulfuricella sp.]